MINGEVPLVSICCITYNHVRYIKDALHGFLKQKTNFPIEIIINDDASTDGTTEIVKEYVERYPKLITPIFHEKNQYSQGVRGINASNTFPISRGKYIALCEGDDYWTDPLKLQKQVDFMEQNLDYTLVCGGFIARNTVTQEEKTIIKGSNWIKNDLEGGFDITLERMKKEWLTKTVTSLFRKDAININLLNQYEYGRDVHLFFHLIKAGKGYYMRELFALYNIHPGGVFSLKSKIEKMRGHYYIYQELYEVNKDDFSRYMYLKGCLKILNYKISFLLRGKDFTIFSILKESLFLVKTRQERKALIKAFIPLQIKKFWHKSAF